MPAAVQLFIGRFEPSDLRQWRDRWLGRFDGSEQARHHALRHERRRHDWLSGRRLACEALTAILGEVHPAALRTHANGGLAYQAAELNLSLSHSHGLAAVAIAPASIPIGVDVERIRVRALVEHADQVFGAQEAEHILQSPKRYRLPQFYRCWTLKEAFCKAAGVPLWTALRGAEFDLQRGTAQLPSAEQGWQFLSARLARDWVLAVAIRAPDTTLATAAQHWVGGQWQPQPLLAPVRLRGDSLFKDRTTLQSFPQQ